MQQQSENDSVFQVLTLSQPHHSFAWRAWLPALKADLCIVHVPCLNVHRSRSLCMRNQIMLCCASLCTADVQGVILL